MSEDAAASLNGLPPAGEQSETAPKAESTVPLRQKVAWASGSITDQFMANGINNLALPIYNISLGISPVLISWALAIPRIFDAVTDPIIGNLSDNARTRWGRRRPFILVGAILCALTFALIWMPPLFLGPTGIFLFFLLFSLLYYLAYTIFAVPRHALGYELSPDYRERTNIFAFNAIFAGMAGLLMPWMYRLSFHPIFAGPEGDEVVGVRYVGILVGVLIILTSLPVVFMTRERFATIAQPKIALLRATRLTLANRPFQIITGVVVFTLLSVMLVGPLNLYINIYYICDGDRELGAYWGGWAGSVQALSGLLSTPVIAYVANRLGKRTTLAMGLSLAIAAYASSWWLFNPEYPWLQLFFMMMIQPGLMCIWVLNGSIIADICDHDELHNGMRREGMFGAAFTLITKFASAGITIVAGYLLVVAGWRDEATVTPQTILNLRLLFATIPAVLLCIAIVLVLRYPLTEQTAYAIRDQLRARRGETAPQ